MMPLAEDSPSPSPSAFAGLPCGAAVAVAATCRASSAAFMAAAAAATAAGLGVSGVEPWPVPMLMEPTRLAGRPGMPLLPMVSVPPPATVVASLVMVLTMCCSCSWFMPLADVRSAAAAIWALVMGPAPGLAEVRYCIMPGLADVAPVAPRACTSAAAAAAFIAGSVPCGGLRLPWRLPGGGVTCGLRLLSWLPNGWPDLPGRCCELFGPRELEPEMEEALSWLRMTYLMVLTMLGWASSCPISASSDTPSVLVLVSLQQVVRGRAR